MSLVIPEQIVKASGLSEEELLIEVVLLLFKQDKISLGKAAELLNMSQIRLQKIMADRSICIHYDVDELQQDIQHLTAKRWL